jgi:ZIP family zinc transporter
MLFIGLALVASCKERGLSHTKAFLISGTPGIVLAVMAFAGVTIISHLQGALHQGILAFGIAALLYLVTEELLVEAHESPDEPVEAAGFFGGFLVILALALL